MNSVRSLMGDVSFHGMATPPRCAMLREAVTHVAGLRCYPCRRTVPICESWYRLTRGIWTPPATASRDHADCDEFCECDTTSPRREESIPSPQPTALRAA